jgi:hypothetical protein
VCKVGNRKLTETKKNHIVFYIANSQSSGFQAFAVLFHPAKISRKITISVKVLKNKFREASMSTHHSSSTKYHYQRYPLPSLKRSITAEARWSYDRTASVYIHICCVAWKVSCKK